MHPRQLQVDMVQQRIGIVVTRYFNQQAEVRSHARPLFNECCALAVAQPLPPPRRYHTSDTFIEISLDMADPLSLCWHLEERLGLPLIPRIRRQRIPTTLDIQDLTAFHNHRADPDMTIASFARGLATWLKRCHPHVLARLVR